jgi:hypothetical protein
MQKEEYKIRQMNKKYFQKSTFFLYPLLKIPKIVIPMQTYLYWDHSDYLEKTILICRFKKFTAANELKIEEANILSHPLYLNHYELEDDSIVYIFSLEQYKAMVELFLKGKYSKFSTKIKENILSFYKPESHSKSYIRSYLYPEYYYTLYAELLNVDKSILSETGELIDLPNITKEKLDLKIKNLNITHVN